MLRHKLCQLTCINQQTTYENSKEFETRKLHTCRRMMERGKEMVNIKLSNWYPACLIEDLIYRNDIKKCYLYKHCKYHINKQ